MIVIDPKPVRVSGHLGSIKVKGIFQVRRFRINKKAMHMLFLEIVGYLILILVAAEVFVNALEHLGEKLKISEGVTGSIFAAVGTALPETLVPLLAIFAGTANSKVNEEIGVGAILGAPLMLSTLSLFLMSMAVLKKRGRDGHLTPERTGLKRDLDFFLMAFSLSLVAMFVPAPRIGCGRSSPSSW